MTTFSVRLPDPLKNDLDELAQATNRSRAYLVKEAVAAYVAEQQAYIRELLEAKASAEKGPLYSFDVISRWMDTWGTDHELPPPEPDIFPKRKPKK